MSRQYDEYIREHVTAVGKAAQWMLENVPTLRQMPYDAQLEFSALVVTHDASKHGPDEYDAYDAYFYGEKDEDAFERAWLHHIHNNPHHWQHWVLVNGYGEFGEPGVTTPLEMPRLYALEMIADWWSFSWRSGNLYEVFDWYDNHKQKIVLHEDTRAFVERILGEIREVLDGSAEGSEE